MKSVAQLQVSATYNAPIPIHVLADALCKHYSCVNQGTVMQIFKVWGENFEFPPYKEKQVDWSSFYFQHNIRHALRYLTKKWEDGHSVVSLIRATLINPSIKVIRLDHPSFGNPKISGNEKAELAKALINDKEGIDLSNQLLMRGLGCNNRMLQLLDADQYEVIVPHELFVPQNFKVETVALFRRSTTQKYVTSSYKKGSQTQWTTIKGDPRYEPYLLSHVFEE